MTAKPFITRYYDQQAIAYRGISPYVWQTTYRCRALFSDGNVRTFTKTITYHREWSPNGFVFIGESFREVES
jgi:hypothetical protein